MIEQYVNDIYNALHNKCYYPALALTLALPDICGMVEYPKDDVGKRYINWIDKYLGERFFCGSEFDENEPYLTGEVIYNLRNTFLHQGSPNVQKDKIRKESNQLDRFTIILGDGNLVVNYTKHFGTSEHKDTEYKEIGIEINYLCQNICECARWYYQQNKDKFCFDLNIITKEELENNLKEKVYQDESIIKEINERLEKNGSSKRVSLSEPLNPVEIDITLYD